MSADAHNELRRAVDGDSDAIATLLEQHAPGLRAALAGAVPARWQSVLSVDDVMQETYTDAFLDVAGTAIETAEGFAAWLRKLAQRNLIDALRMLEAEKRGGGTRPQTLAPASDSVGRLLDELESSITTPSRRVIRAEAQARLRAAIRELPDAYRCVLEEYDLQGRPMNAVAEKLGRSLGATYILRSRAHRRLAALLESGSDFFSTRA